MSEAATLEDATEKHPVSPGSIVPARELLGDMFLQTGDLAKALDAFEASLKRNPKRFNGLYGAGYAAEKSGNANKAIQYYKALIELTKTSNATRPEIAKAKTYVASHVENI